MKRLLPLLGLLLLAPSLAGAQQRSCDLIESGRIDRDQASGIVNFLDPFFFRCNDGAELRASQGTLNEFSRELNLVGNVDYRDPQRSLQAQQATYSSVAGRLYATGNVVFEDRLEGITLRGPELEYFRAMPGRPQAQVNAMQRPHLTVLPKGKDNQPLDIDGDRITILGNNDLTVSGNAVIVRPDMRATAGEARYDGAAETLELRQNARVVSKQEYTLAGEFIFAQLAEGGLKQVDARERARLEAKELNVRAPNLQLLFTAGQLTRTVARGPRDAAPADQPIALAKSFRLQADSLDARLPGQTLQEVIAIGRARGETVDSTAAADSAAVGATTGGLLASDWIVGDTIQGFFEQQDSVTAAPRDTAGAPADTAVVLKRLLARGDAQSLYRVERNRSGSTDQQPGINFLSGDTIELTFLAGEVEVADVTGLQRGLYLEPKPAGTPPPASPARREGNG